MTELLYLIFYVGVFFLYIGVVIPAALIVYHKWIRRDGMTAKQILKYYNF